MATTTTDAAGPAAVRPDARYLRVYASDHLALADAIVALCDRVLAANRWADHHAALRPLADALAADRRDVEELVRRHGVTPNPIKRALSVVAERAGRLKGNGRVLRSSPLAPLVELEGLRLGVAGGIAFWETIAALGLDPARSERALARLREQQATLAGLHERIARFAFAG